MNISQHRLVDHGQTMYNVLHFKGYACKGISLLRSSEKVRKECSRALFKALDRFLYIR